MATLVLTAAGLAAGGPIGGAIGAALGQQLDTRLFAPKSRHGPRLGDLSVQTSSYGSQIPKLFGTMRVAGTVIWATDIKEERSRSGGGKGQPKTVAYSYSASFAVALSARPIRAVHRIWAEGKLLRGAAGDFKSATGFRLHPGGEDQPIDPLIAAAEGSGATPAYRGMAYGVFEDLQLADFGNRIPSLTFEVEADPAPLTAGEIAELLTEGQLQAGATVAVGGYAASGASLRAAIEALADLAPLPLRDDGETLVVGDNTLDPYQIGSVEPGATTPGAGGRSEWQRVSGDAVPGEATLTYYDPARDFQTGLQRASRGGGPAADRRAVAAAIGADEAKALADRRLEALWAGRRSAKLHLPWTRAALMPGAALRLEGSRGLWRISRRTLERMVVTIDLAGIPQRTTPAETTGSPGRPVASADLPHGETRLLVFDLPLLSEELPARPRLIAAAAGAEAGWRSAGLTASYDGGASWSAPGATAAPAVIGEAVTAPGAGGPALMDARNSFDVELLNDAMWLESRDDLALASGANLAVLGDELVQFGEAEPLGGRRFRLSRLLRGRRGTEWASGGHVAGEAFALLETDTLAAIDAPLAALGSEARILAVGIGDAEGVQANRLVTGEALRPPSPVHLLGERLDNGDIALSWVRRSRAGWVWLSGSDTPLGEESEAYRVILSAGSSVRSIIVTAPACTYSHAQQIEDGAAGAVTASVVQLGTSAASRPADIIIV